MKRPFVTFLLRTENFCLIEIKLIILLIIILGGYIFLCLPPYNSNYIIRNKTSSQDNLQRGS